MLCRLSVGLSGRQAGRCGGLMGVGFFLHCRSRPLLFLSIDGTGPRMNPHERHDSKRTNSFAGRPAFHGIRGKGSG